PVDNGDARAASPRAFGPKVNAFAASVRGEAGPGSAGCDHLIAPRFHFCLESASAPRIPPRGDPAPHGRLSSCFPPRTGAETLSLPLALAATRRRLQRVIGVANLRIATVSHTNSQKCMPVAAVRAASKASAGHSNTDDAMMVKTLPPQPWRTLHAN